MKNINPINTDAWKKLQQHFIEIKNIHIKNFFDKFPNRYKTMFRNFQDAIFIDFSKNRLNEETLNLLFQLCEETHLRSAINAMFEGKKINVTENRSVLHTALRNRTIHPIFSGNLNVMPLIHDELNRIKNFSDTVIQGIWKGYTEKNITDIVNIGIGGSDLGPKMVVESLKDYQNHLKIHFVSNIDGSHIKSVLDQVNPETTLFIVVSKTFNTEETLFNAHYAKEWFFKRTKLKNIKILAKHFIAVSENITKTISFGIPRENIFQFWDWVGGRYSLWSAVGLSIVLSLGFDNFLSLLDGAYNMDQHFFHNEFYNNIPVILALISIWYMNFFNTETEAIFPYDQNMINFPFYLQQAVMESNGKSINRLGKRVQWKTCPVIWGSPGTNGQHAFYQMLHQGTTLIPCDFIISITPNHTLLEHHNRLTAHFIAQTRALAFGSNDNFLKCKYHNQDKDFLHIFQSLQGNHPSNSILLNHLNPFSLGSLIALYEHKIFVQGVILNIFSFDQWGVELGKQLASEIYADITSSCSTIKYDTSTNNIINLCKKRKKN
ncbi:glucose-6-phosphate isomerase [Buchnera aphidicola (Thelaxes californica)]|uniref:Glucose-6-phosphate isomerase n=1 Tax=Buchnera aphidicola (Thelaxes californica) TaxID=1315998 RepID=A0A4D6YFQ4_9GAMM|nr:glucose-6-phosphate isomerase [Buchnera aphidicola]QCI26963.1 glucose-6-phosphate isomerase [Buchnera aphidicola (Thelaxes californica)]